MPRGLWVLFFILGLVNFSHGADLVGGREVVLNTATLTWYDAFDACEAIDMRLLSLHSNKEFNELREIAKKDAVNVLWVAGTDEGYPGRFYWKTTSRPFTFARWILTMPEAQNKHHHCTEFHWSAVMIGLNIEWCQHLRRFYCVKEPKQTLDMGNMLRLSMAQSQSGAAGHTVQSRMGNVVFPDDD